MKCAEHEGFDLTQRTVFGLLSRNLFGVDFHPEAEVEWESVLQESKYQAVFLQAFESCQEIPEITGELLNRIKAKLVRGMINNARVHAQHTDLHRLLTEHGIPYVILKGAASAGYYPEPQNRMMGDVDFYVDRSDFERAMALFRETGFEASDLDHICHVVLRKKGVHMEMHHTPAGVPDGAVGLMIRGYLTDLREQAVLVEKRTVTCCCPSDFHHGLIMLMHFQHHLLAEGVGLRHLCDWAVFVNHFQGDAFPALFRERLKKVGLWQLARLLSLCAARYLGLPEKAWMWERKDDGDAASALMRDIVAGGNFGRKDRQRVYEGLFISNRGKDGVQNHRVKRGLKALSRITCRKYPFFEKWSVLMPVGWLITLTGYLVHNRRRASKGKQIHSLDAYIKSGQRLQLYQRLNLYQPEK